MIAVIRTYRFSAETTMMSFCSEHTEFLTTDVTLGCLIPSDYFLWC